MIENEVSPEEFYQAGKGMENDYVSCEKLDELIAKNDSLVVVDLRTQERVQDQKYKKVIHISMEDMVTENLEELIPVKSTPIVLVCDQSFGMSRMVALTTYAYPTLKLMGYDNLKILQDIKSFCG